MKVGQIYCSRKTVTQHLPIVSNRVIWKESVRTPIMYSIVNCPHSAGTATPVVMIEILFKEVSLQGIKDEDGCILNAIASYRKHSQSSTTDRYE